MASQSSSSSNQLYNRFRFGSVRLLWTVELWLYIIREVRICIHPRMNKRKEPSIWWAKLMKFMSLNRPSNLNINSPFNWRKLIYILAGGDGSTLCAHGQTHTHTDLRTYNYSLLSVWNIHLNWPTFECGKRCVRYVNNTMRRYFLASICFFLCVTVRLIIYLFGIFERFFVLLSKKHESWRSMAIEDS